jgi:AcrR family transcriptional regulator
VVLERANGGDITVQDVADEAGQSLRTLYQYFESKDDLLLALFEESMRAYARLLERAVRDVYDPLERLAGALLAAMRMPEVTESGLNRGLVGLRLRLADTEPELVGRAQSSVVAFMKAVIADARDAGVVEVEDVDAATFMVMSLNAAWITAQRIGNDAGVTGPDRLGAVRFCVGGLGGDTSVLDLKALDKRISLPAAASKS